MLLWRESTCTMATRNTAAETCNKHEVEWLDRLVCPSCRTLLRRGSQRLFCPSCKAAVPLINGTLPDFLNDFPYWGEFSQAQMREVNRRAVDGSWKSALLHFDDPALRRVSERILDLDRANWHRLVPLPADSRVLDIGAGLGTHAHALAKHYREVIAVEPVLEAVRFMRQRFMEEQLSNAGIVRSSIWKLPFAPESFDVVVLNGVLERVAEGQDGDPAELQRSALEQAARMLRPGGYLSLGVENRFVPGYFTGRPDPRCGLPFVTVLPRRIANWYAKKCGQEGYRSYLYSSRGYQRLLLRAGFSQVELYIASPNHNHPRYLIPFTGGSFPFYAANAGSPQTNWLGRAGRRALRLSGLLKYLERSFIILARK
jgi:LSD1 subclass zinc finger protein